MPPPRRHLLLPSEKGLVHYDLLEETAFVGPGPRGSIVASPTPFPEAKIALSDDGRGFVARALPGEPPPEINGAPGEGVRLADGARIRVGDQIALYRTAEAVVAPATAGTPATTGAVAPRPRTGGPAPRVSVPSGASTTAKVLMLGGALLLVGAAYQAVRYLETKGAAPVPPVTATMLEDPPLVRSTPEEQAHAEFERLAASDTGDLTKLADVYDGYTSLARSAPGTLAGERAAMRLRELRPKLAAATWKSVSTDVDAALRQSRYRTALGLLQGFEARFGGTEAALDVPSRIASVRADARAALDALGQRVAPLLAKDGRRAYRLLTTTNLELPTDLTEELAALIAHVREGGAPPTPLPPEPTPPSPTPPPANPTPPSPPGPTPNPTAKGPFSGRPRPKEIPDEPGTARPPATPPSEANTLARTLWLQAHEHLVARRFPEARDAYGRLKKEFSETPVVLAHPERVKAGYKAADVGVRGPVAFLREEAKFENGRLECEWSFDDDKAFLEDFSVEQAFVGLDPAECEIRSGMAILSGSTAILVNVVFDPIDVTWEADCVADSHHDYGLFGRQESKEIRTLLLDVGNTQFKLKKGAAAKVLAAHVLFLFGEGVWKDADKGDSGFIRLAEQPGAGIKAGERVHLQTEVRGDKVEAMLVSKSDTASFKAPLKGDDGRGMGPLHVGAFAYKGRVGVERLKVSGKVDESWALEAFQKLVAAETGPD